MVPQRMQSKRIKGFDLQLASLALNGLPAVLVTRPGPYGNPFIVGRDGTAKQCVAKFRRAWADAIECAKRNRTPYMPLGKTVYLGHIIGKNLACFCREDAPFCHADVLLEITRDRTIDGCALALRDSSIHRVPEIAGALEG